VFELAYTGVENKRQYKSKYLVDLASLQELTTVKPVGLRDLVEEVHSVKVAVEQGGRRISEAAASAREVNPYGPPDGRTASERIAQLLGTWDVAQRLVGDDWVRPEWRELLNALRADAFHAARAAIQETKDAQVCDPILELCRLLHVPEFDGMAHWYAEKLPPVFERLRIAVPTELDAPESPGAPAGAPRQREPEPEVVRPVEAEEGSARDEGQGRNPAGGEEGDT
jgi:hypothetical protein